MREPESHKTLEMLVCVMERWALPEISSDSTQFKEWAERDDMLKEALILMWHIHGMATV